MLKNHVNRVIEFIFEDKNRCISVVPMNDLAPMKNCHVVQRYVKLVPRLWAILEDNNVGRIKQCPLTHRLNSSIVCIIRCTSYIFCKKRNYAMFSVDFDGSTNNSNIVR